jgi:hypothetical protein
MINPQVKIKNSIQQLIMLSRNNGSIGEIKNHVGIDGQSTERSKDVLTMKSMRLSKQSKEIVRSKKNLNLVSNLP